MHKLNPDCWVCSPGPPCCLLPQRPASAGLNRREAGEDEDEEEAGEHPAVCCYAAGCDDVISQADDARWFSSKPAVLSGISSCSRLAGRHPGAPPSQQPINTDQGDLSQYFIGGRSWEGPRMETQGCVCAYGQREPEAVGSCWPGAPYLYYGVRSSLLVGVEVVEEVAVEDTLEVITEDIYTDDLLGPEVLHDDQLYPT